MSSGPTGTGDGFSYKGYYNLRLTRSDWCKYRGECPIGNNIPGSYCWTCKFCEKLNIPKLLDKSKSKW